MSSAQPDPHLPTHTVILTDDTPSEDHSTQRAVPAWILSIVTHAVVLLLLGLIVAVQRDERDEPPIEMVALSPVEIEKPKPLENTEKPEQVVLEITTEAVEPNPLDVIEPLEEETSTIEEPIEDIARGEPDAVSDSAMADVGYAMAIGPGANAAGPWGRRGLGKKRAIGEHGTPGTEAAVHRSLNWFKRHQSPNGQWDIDGYPANCQENPKCEPGQEHTGADGDLAGSGYALLCFLGAGYDHRMPSRFRSTVQAGLDWLVSQQGADGSFGRRNYEHSIATMALVEALAMSADTRLREPGQKAIDVLLARQIRSGDDDYGLGWDYTRGTQRNDASVTGWAAMALKSAMAAGLDVGNGMTGVKRYLDQAWQATNPDHAQLDPYTGQSTFPYTWNSGTGAVDINRGAQHKDLASVGALLAVFNGHLAGDPMLESLCNYIVAKQTPTGYPTNTYYLYYNTLALYMADTKGAERWHRWNENVLHDLLVNAQRTGDGCMDGSWDWAGTVFHGHKTGRLLSTAYCCLSLEVYYRYVQTDLAKERRKAGVR